MKPRRNKSGDESKDESPVDKDDLSVVRRGLYSKQEPEEFRRRQDVLSKLGITRRPRTDTEHAEDTMAVTKYRNLAWQRAKRMGRIFRFSGLLLVILVLIIWAGIFTVWYRSSQTVTDRQVRVEISGQQEFTAGDEIVYTIKYANDSRVLWKDVELIFTEPSGFVWRGSDVELEQSGRLHVLKLGDVEPGEEGAIQIRGQLIGEQNQTAVAKAEMFVTPENFPSGRFSKSSLLATTITALSLDVAVEIPKDSASGERVVAIMSVRNLSDQDLDNVYVKLTPAPGVELLVNDQDFSPGFLSAANEWQILQLDSLDTQEFQFVFVVSGQTGEQRQIELEAGIQQDDNRFVQRLVTQVIQISRSELAIEQFYNDSNEPLVVVADEVVQGVVRYVNVGSTGLKDVIVKVKFEGTGFDGSDLKLSAGAFDSESQTVTWTAATVPALAVVQPLEEGEIAYSFKVQETDSFPTDPEIGKNNVIVTTATIDSPDLPAPPGQPREVVSDRAVLSVQTNAELTTDALFDDGRLGITSSGPLPPRVGETTTYTIRVRIGSTLNDVSDVRLELVLPDGVSHTGETYKTGGDLTFNDRAGQFIWTLLQMDGLTGRGSPSHELHVQVAVTPGENLRGKSIDFLNKAQLQFVDQFTDNQITEKLNVFPSTNTVISGGNGEVE